MRKMRNLTLVLGTIATAASPALAVKRVYHGVHCRSSDPESVTPQDNGLKMATDDSVYCPLIRDEPGTSHQLHDIYVELYSSNTGTQCQLTTQEEDLSGTTPAVVYDSHLLADSSTGNIELGPFSPGSDRITTTAGNEGAYHVRCDLDADSVVYQIYVNEPNASNGTGDLKSYHGNFCRTADPLDSSPTETGLLVESEDAVDVFCPEIRDRINSTEGIVSNYVELYAASAGTRSCTQYAQTEDVGGSTYDSSTAESTSTGNIQIGSMAPSTTNPSGYDEGSYVLVCELQEGDILYHNWLNEKASSI